MEPVATPIQLSERFKLHNITFYWPMFGHFISVSSQDGSSTKLLTIDEAYTLIQQLITV